MRGWMVAAALAGAAAAGRADAQAGGRTFISPMGEPFRGLEGGATPQARWFAAADLDHDGKLTVDEMRKDAQRFFATLDTNHDGEIDPAETEHYEAEVAPEVAALLSMSGSRETGSSSDDFDVTQKDKDGYPMLNPNAAERGRRHRRGGGDDLPTAYLGLTEPVTSADRNLNRGVSRAEFDAAAQQRFHALDRAGQGFLTPEALKPLLR